MNLEELKAYNELLKEANYVLGVGYQYVKDGETVTVSASDYAKELSRVQKEIKSIEVEQIAKRKATTSRANIVRVAQKGLAEKDRVLVQRLNAAQTRLNDAVGSISRGASQLVGDVPRLEQQVIDAQEAISRAGLVIDEKGFAVRQTGRRGPAQTRTTQTEVATTTTQPVSPSATPSDSPNARVAQEIAKDSTEPTVIKSETKRINDVPVRVDTYSDGTTKTSKDLSSPGAATTGQTATGTKGKATGGKKPRAKMVNWEPTFRDTFPAKAWLLDLDRDKYPGLFALLQKAVSEKYTNERFAAEVDGTDFYKEIAQSGKVREIKSIVGDLGFDSTDFTKFVSDSINFGWKGDTLKQKTYEEVFRRNADGAYANPTALARAKKSNDFLNVQLVATNYFNRASDSAIESVLTGKIMLEDFQRQQREIAKSKYSHLSSLIDQGVTLEDLSSNFKQSAARLLEIDPQTIDMGQADYEIALNFGEADKRRVMTTGEWERLLRTDSRYGWEKTENAKQEARSLASNIAQAFGRII